MASFESGAGSEDQYQKYPIRRLEPSIQKFLKVIKIDLGRLHQHKLNIEKFNRLHDWTSLNGENINATRTVQQIKANLQEIEKVRHQVLEEDLDAFDNKINDMRESAIQSVLEFASLSGTQTKATGSSATGRKSSTPDYETSPPAPGHRVQGRRTVSESTAQFSVQDLPENSNVEESWENLQESLEDLNTMIHEFATVVNSQQEKIDKIEDNIDQAEADVQRGTINLGKATGTVDVHQYSFHGLQAKDVLQGELSIQIMDYVSTVLRAQFKPSVGLLAPSYLFGLEMAKEKQSKIVADKSVLVVQIHYIYGHFLVSLQRNRKVFVYDSLYNPQHLQSLEYQLKLLYKDVNIKNVSYVVQQSQGQTNLCGFFAIATAESLLRNGVLDSQMLDTSLMRNHLYQCLMDGSIRPFPRSSIMFGRKDTVSACNQSSKEYLSDEPSTGNKNRKIECHNKHKFKQSVTARERDRTRKQIQRLDPNFYMRDKERSKISKQKSRTNPIQQEKDREATKTCKLKKRKEASFREKDKERTMNCMSKKRKDPSFQEKDKERTMNCMSKKRKEPSFQEKDKERTMNCMSKLRKEQAFQEKDKARTMNCMSKKRKEQAFQEKDKARTKDCMSKLRKEQAFQEKDKARTMNCMSKKRKEQAFQEKDKARTKDCMSRRRKEPEYQDKDKARTRTCKSKRRNHQHIQEIERQKMKLYMRQKRKDPILRHKQRTVLNIHRQKVNLSSKYNSTLQNAMNQKRKEQRNEQYTVQTAAYLFQKVVSKGCSFICTCCHQVWFENAVLRASGVRCDNEQLRNSCFTGKLSVDDKEWMCVTCAGLIRKNKLPVMAVANGMFFPEKPTILHLNSLEERLVAPVNPFMQLRELPSGGQVSIRGNVVNVPADNYETVTSLPQRLDQSGTIPVKLKRRLRYKSHYMYENVRPRYCMQAVKYLLSKPLYKQYVVNGIDENWLSSVNSQQNTDWGEFLRNNESDEITKSTKPTETTTVTNDSLNKTEQDDSDTWSEEDNDEEGSAGMFDTMMFDEVIDNDINKVICVAPSEGNQPLTGSNPDLEELAFPTIFCGDRRINNKDRLKPVKYSEICKSELRREDRRAAISTANIFFKTKKLQYKLIQDKVWLSMKRIQSKGTKLTASYVKDSQNIEKLVHLDEGYRIFRTLRGSPPYWEAAKKDIFAMLRQLGTPTWFFTLSAAETKWTDLLQNLSLLVDNKKLNEEQANNLSYNTKSRLIRSDPVTTARYFHYRIQAFFTYFLLSAAEPLGRIIDFFIRIEFQHRGSPHLHCLLWVENAPTHNIDDPVIVQTFIDKYISTSNSGEHPDLIRRQTHRHSHTCKKKGKTCRFGIPLPPMQTTTILSPLTDLEPQELLRHKENWTTAATLINDLKTDTDITFEEFLLSTGLSYEQYIMSLRSTLKDDRVFLQRHPNSVRINAYNLDVLKTWQANMDLQYITDAYACAMYIISYMSKGQRGMSDLLQRACSDARKHSTDIRQQVRTISDKFLRHVEISAQEAVFLTLQMPLRRSSRGFTFINTSPRDERPFILKPQELLDVLPEDSEDIKCSNIIQRYSERPKILNNMTLAEFAAWYDVNYRKQNTQTKTKDELLEDNNDDNEEDDIPSLQKEYVDNITLTSGTQMKKRRQKKIIRYTRYSKKKDPENYYRESLMLFHPWQSEDSIIEDSETYEEMYHKVEEELERNRALFELKAEEIDQVEEQLQNELNSDIWNTVAPNTEHQNLDDRQADATIFVENENLFTHYDIGESMGLPGSDAQEETIRNRMDDDEFRNLVQNLNRKQKEIFYHVLKAAKLNQSQQYIFISGGAGVGKTQVLKAIHQALIRHYNTTAGDNPEAMTVLLVAPTGKAAYLIRGQTIHTAMHIPANQGFNYKRLTHEMLNSLRVKYEHLKFLIIDEISMCGSAMFNFINVRLQEIFQNTIPFGGIHVITVGDLFQLRPVQDNWIFKLSARDYSPLAPNLWTDNFNLYELTEIMRQKDDKQFAETLNRVREGNHTENDVRLLQGRIIFKSSSNYPVNAVHIMYHNQSVEEHNTIIYQMSTTQKVNVEAQDIVIGDIPPEVKKQILTKAPDKAKDAMGLGKFVKTAVNLRNELTVNVDTQDGLVNGASCVTKAFTMKGDGLNPSIVWVQFDHADIGLSLRQNSKHLYASAIEKDWTPIKTITREFPVGRYKNAKLMRRQFPLQLASAKTVHRSQGDTLSAAVLSLPSQRRAHLHYVALSRVTSLQCLHILDEFHPEKITVSNEVKDEMQRLRTTSQLQIQTQVYQLPADMFTITFQNCQSLKHHINDIRLDTNFTYSRIMMFVETKLSSSDSDDQLSIPNFSLFRNDFQAQRTPYGTAIYHRQITDYVFNVHNSCDIETTSISVLHPVQLTIFCIYIRPKQAINSILRHISVLKYCLNANKRNIIMGDFNVNASTDNSTYRKLQKAMLQLGLRQLIHEPTTNCNTTIDHIYTDIETPIQHGVLESYYSYHKPLWISLY